MKRTAVITLAILGALSTSGCKNEPGPTSYANVTECTKEHDYNTCKAAFLDAQKQTEASAPKFASADQCAAQFANCQKSSSGDWFMPAVMGYMIGSMNSGSRAPATPIYVDRSGHHQAASFTNGTYRPQPAPQTYTAKTAAARATTSSRGGFGTRSSSASS